MSSTRYDSELAKLPGTYAQALTADIRRVKTAIAGANESSIISVGSGGSFTTASLLCSLHEAYTGRVSRPSTPLEIICNPTLAAASPVFLISAEGKNPDIIEALQRARLQSARPVHVLTNHRSSPLLECANSFTDITAHVFELTEKDGYLATNSLLLNAVVVARAYGELDKAEDHIPPGIDDLRLGDSGIDNWLREAEGFVRLASAHGSVIVTFSPQLRPIAADLESKLAESALLFCQLADLRSFAHGRHLWLAERPKECSILAMIEPSLRDLWESMRTLIPSEVPVLTMPFGGAKPKDLLAGLVAQMRLVSSFAKCAGKDPGRPDVPQFGRDIHYINLPALIPTPTEPLGHGEQSKLEVLGARWPSIQRRGAMRRAVESFEASLEQQVFRAIVFDYDGTLCSSQSLDRPPSDTIVQQLSRLIDGGIHVGIASGRGGSINEYLKDKLPVSSWSKVHLGLYNAGRICDLGETFSERRETSEFLSHVTRIVNRLKALGVPIDHIRTTHPYQVSIRFLEGAQVEGNWFVIADALRQAGLDLSRVVRSKHSIDVLAAGVNKSLLVAHIIQRLRIEPYEVLTLGDQGAWPGNDTSLLEHRFSLSVDVPSRRLDRGWKLAPGHKRNVDATLWYLERVLLIGDGKFKVEVSNQTHTSTR